MNRIAGGRLVWPPVFLLIAASCSAFEAGGDTPPETTTDGGASSSSSSGSDAATDAKPGECLRVAPFEQAFSNGDVKDWKEAPASGDVESTDYSPLDTGGAANDGSVEFSYQSGSRARRRALEKQITSGRCFDYELDFSVKFVSDTQLLFTEVKYANDHLLLFAIDPQSHEIFLAQQDLASHDVTPLAYSKDGIDDGWHHLSMLVESNKVTALLDELPFDPVTAPPALLDFDTVKTVEVGVSYSQAGGSADIEIDRVVFQ